MLKTNNFSKILQNRIYHEEEIINDAFSLYKELYNLETKLDVWRGINEIFYFSHKSNVINFQYCPFNKYKPGELLAVLLHEIGHAIQHKKCSDIDKCTRNFDFLINLEIAAERFAVKEYYRRYGHFGKYPISSYDGNQYLFAFKQLNPGVTVKNPTRKIKGFRRRLYNLI